jgi:hypothetical protein
MTRRDDYYYDRPHSRRRRSCRGTAGYLSDLLDNVYGFMEDVLDRGGDVEHDVRGTLSRAIDPRDCRRRPTRRRYEDDDDRFDLDDELRDRLEDLRDGVGRLLERLGGRSRDRAEAMEERTR